MAKKAYIGVPSFEPVKLPSGYTQVEYIQSSGTQYIDTGFKPNNNTKIVLDFELMSTVGDYLALYGSRNGATSAQFWALFRSSDGKYDGRYGAQTSVLQGTSGNRHLIISDKNTFSIDGTKSSFTVESFSGNYNVYICAINDEGAMQRASCIKIFNCQIYNNGVLARNYIPSKNSNGTAGLYDTVNSVFYMNAGTGTFAAGTSYDSVAKKCKSIYIGISGIARRVLYGYVGDGNGIARKFWSSVLQLSYYGTTTNLSSDKEYHAAGSTEDYAIFGGGDKYSGAVDAYNGNLTRSAAASMTSYRQYLKAASINGKVIFAGGETSSDYTTGTTDSYNNSLTRTSLSSISSVADHAAASTDTYAMFGGGRYKRSNTSYGKYSTVWAFNKSLSQTGSSLSTERESLVAASAGAYVLFAGGDSGNYETNYHNEVDAINNSMTRTIATALPYYANSMGAASCNNRAIFAGGHGVSNAGDTYSQEFNTVTCYTSSLTRQYLQSLSSRKSALLGASIDGYCIFSGGAYSNIKTADIYNSSFTRIMTINMAQVRSETSAAAVAGKYLIYAGGVTSPKTTEAFILDYA